MIYVLLPVYNEESNLELLLAKIQRVMERRKYDYHVVVYNDGSSDDSGKILKHARDIYPLTLIEENKNRGLGYAMSRLFDHVLANIDTLDIIIVMDADNTHNPELIYKMKNWLLDGYDIVIASRFLPESRVVGLSLLRRILSKCVSLMMRLCYPIRGVKDYTCGYRAYKASCLKNARDHYRDKFIEEAGFACMLEILLKLRSLDALAVEVPLLLRYDHKGGESKMKLIHTIIRTLVTATKTRP